MKSEIGKALGMSGMGDDADEAESPDETVKDEKPKGGSPEVKAMKKFMMADTAEAKAAAMKLFMDLCGEY